MQQARKKTLSGHNEVKCSRPGCPQDNDRRNKNKREAGGDKKEAGADRELTLSDTAGAMAVKGNPASFEQEDGVSGLGEDLTSYTTQNINKQANPVRQGSHLAKGPPLRKGREDYPYEV